MANEYYQHGTFPTTGAQATSAGMRAELDSIAAGFEKLPPLAGNAGKLVKVNATGTALAVGDAAVSSVNGKTGEVTLAKADLGLASVEDKSSATIRGEITAGNVTSALGFTPVNAAAAPTIVGLREARVALGTGTEIDLAAGNWFSRTVSGATAFTLKAGSVPAAGTAASFILDLTNGGAFAVSWWGAIKWAGGAAPALTAAGRDVLGFYSHDGGATWTGLLLGKDLK